MNLDFTQEYQAFRDEVRDFLEAHKDSAPRMSDRGVRSEKRKAWQKILLEHGYAARTLPKEYGGHGAAPDALKSRIIAEEFSRAKYPAAYRVRASTCLCQPCLNWARKSRSKNISNRH